MPAEYPPSMQLIRAIEQHFDENNIELGARALWKWFVEARQAVRAVPNHEASLLWDSSNPEIVASFLDLSFEALGSEDQDIDAFVGEQLRRIRAVPRDQLVQTAIDEAARIVDERFKKPARAPLVAARRAKQGLLGGVVTYFTEHHFRDGRKSPSGPGYLEESLAVLQSGDVVITTNYDCLAERVLISGGKWSPTNGYGFDVPLRSFHSADAHLFAKRPCPKLPEIASRPSDIRVLKLHGSVGWRKLPQTYGPSVIGDDYFDGPQVYLSHELFDGFFASGSRLSIYDSREPPFGDPGEPAIVLPTYLKRNEGREFRSIWAQAFVCLSQADSLLVVGSSLPESDIGVRVLLNPIRQRVDRKQLHVTIQNPAPEAFQRWKTVLGGNIEWDKRPLG